MDIRELKQRRRRRQQERQENNRVKLTPFHVRHAFLYISLPSLHDYHLKVTGHVLYTVNGFECVNFEF